MSPNTVGVDPRHKDPNSGSFTGLCEDLIGRNLDAKNKARLAHQKEMIKMMIQKKEEDNLNNINKILQGYNRKIGI